MLFSRFYLPALTVSLMLSFTPILVALLGMGLAGYSACRDPAAAPTAVLRPACGAGETNRKAPSPPSERIAISNRSLTLFTRSSNAATLQYPWRKIWKMRLACIAGRTRYSKQVENLDMHDACQVYRQDMTRSFDDGFESFH